MSEEDVLIVDRCFRDSLELLQELGIRVEMPSFVQKGEIQLLVETSNIIRMVTKIRRIVESVNGGLTLWKYFNRVLPNSQIPYIADCQNRLCPYE